MAVRRETIIEEDMGWDKIKENLKKLNGSYTEVGLFGEGSDPETNLAYRGHIQEFGRPRNGIPSRPFTRRAFDGNRTKIEKKMADEVGLVLDLKQDARRAIARIGEEMQGLIQSSITMGGWIALKLRTILNKKSSRPLIDSGDMRREVKHKDYIR